MTQVRLSNKITAEVARNIATIVAISAAVDVDDLDALSTLFDFSVSNVDRSAEFIVLTLV